MKLNKVNFPVLVWSIGFLVVNAMWFEKLALEMPVPFAIWMPAYLVGSVAVLMLGQHLLSLLVNRLRKKDNGN